MITLTNTWLYKQLFTNWKKFEVTYVSILILIQLAVFWIVPDSLIGMISGGHRYVITGLRDERTQDRLYLWDDPVSSHDLYRLDQSCLWFICNGHLLCHLATHRLGSWWGHDQSNAIVFRLLVAKNSLLGLLSLGSSAGGS